MVLGVLGAESGTLGALVQHVPENDEEQHLVHNLALRKVTAEIGIFQLLTGFGPVLAYQN